MMDTEKEKNFFGGIQPGFMFGKSTTGDNNNNINNNNNNNNNNKNKISNKVNENMQRFGIRELPENVKVFEVEFDMGLAKSIDEETKPVIRNVVHYISYDIAKTATDVAIRIYGAYDEHDNENVKYQITATFLRDVKFDISAIVSELRSYAPLRIRDNLQLYYDHNEKRHVMEVPVSKNPLKVVKMSKTMIHFYGPLTEYTYDDPDTRDTTKRKRAD